MKDYGSVPAVEANEARLGEVGKRTTFRVDLPVARTEERAPAAVVEPGPAATRRGRILVVDDEKMILNIVNRVLSGEHDVVITDSARHELLLVAPEQAGRMIFLTGGAFTTRARTFLSETPREHIEKPFDSRPPTSGPSPGATSARTASERALCHACVMRRA